MATPVPRPPSPRRQPDFIPAKHRCTIRALRSSDSLRRIVTRYPRSGSGARLTLTPCRSQYELDFFDKEFDHVFLTIRKTLHDEFHPSPHNPRISMNALEVVECFGAAWAAHDLDVTMSLITADCIFDSTGPAPDGVRCVGHDAIRAAWQPIFDDVTSRFEAEEVFASEDRVIQRWRYSWTDGHIRGVDIFRVRDGLVSEKLSYVKG